MTPRPVSQLGGDEVGQTTAIRIGRTDQIEEAGDSRHIRPRCLPRHLAGSQCPVALGEVRRQDCNEAANRIIGGLRNRFSHCHQLPFNFLVAGFRRFFGGGAGPGPGGTSRMGRANRSANFRRISRTRRSGGFIRWWCHTSCHGAESKL